MKKILFVILLSLVPVHLSNGCSSDAGDDGTIRFWQFWDMAIIEPIVREFERQNPGITVRVEQLTWQSGLEKIQAAVASGTQPDLCELGSTWLPRFSYEGVLEDLTPVYNEVGDDFIMWDSAKWQGRVYGLPWVQGSRALFYNKDLFVRAGLNPDKPPETWDDLLKAAMLIDGLGDDIHGFGLNLGERYVLYKKFMAFAWGNGGGILGPDGSVVFDSDRNLEALEFYQALAEYSLKEKQEVLDHNFRSGLLGMQISGAWNLRNYALEAPDLEYRVALVPRPRHGSGNHGSFAGAEMLVVFKNTKRRANALKLARFLQDYEQAKKICLEVKSVFPASKRAMDDPTFVDDEKIRVFVEQSLTSQTAPAHPGWIDMEDVINRSIEEVLYGRVEPKQSLQTAAGKIKDVLERFE
jgi:multiple sugar transport system substrate-binding protein